MFQLQNVTQDGMETSASSNKVESTQNDVLRDNSLITLNDTLLSMGQSPAKLQIVASHNKKAYGKRKLDQIYVASHGNLSKVLFVDEIVQHEDVPFNLNEIDDEEPLNNMISRMKKITNSTFSTRAQNNQMLCLAPSCWSRTKVADIFNVSEMRHARSIDIFSLPPPRKGKTLKGCVVQKVKEFYHENSRVMPGMKDRISIGKAQYEQKRLLLCTLSELHTAFKEQNPEDKVGFTKFCMLRPKWCIGAGASGFHNICVCTIHQNVVLL